MCKSCLAGNNNRKVYQRNNPTVCHHGQVGSDSTNHQSHRDFKSAQVKNEEDFFLGEKRVVTSKNMMRNEVDTKIHFVEPKIG